MTSTRRAALEAAGLVHPNAELVTAELFDGSIPFFLADELCEASHNSSDVKSSVM
jgi:hypothetical protein